MQVEQAKATFVCFHIMCVDKSACITRLQHINENWKHVVVFGFVWYSLIKEIKSKKKIKEKKRKKFITSHQNSTLRKEGYFIQEERSKKKEMKRKGFGWSACSTARWMHLSTNLMRRWRLTSHRVCGLSSLCGSSPATVAELSLHVHIHLSIYIQVKVLLLQSERFWELFVSERFSILSFVPILIVTFVLLRVLRNVT